MKSFLNLNSISTRLILLSIAIILFSALTQIFILTNYLRKDVIELASVQLMTIANYAARDIDRDIEDRRDLLKRIAAQFNQSLLDNQKELETWLGKCHGINPLFSNGLFVISLQGVALADYPAMKDRLVHDQFSFYRIV